jgi:hypothetical protein
MQQQHVMFLLPGTRLKKAGAVIVFACPRFPLPFLLVRTRIGFKQILIRR